MHEVPAGQVAPALQSSTQTPVESSSVVLQRAGAVPPGVGQQSQSEKQPRVHTA